MTNLINVHIPCHSLFGAHFADVKVHVALLNLTNSHVALLILGVEGPQCCN